MESFDGTESCELLGSFLLFQIKMKHGDGFGLYTKIIGLASLKQHPVKRRILRILFDSFIIELSLSLIFKNSHGVNNDHKSLKKQLYCLQRFGALLHLQVKIGR